MTWSLCAGFRTFVLFLIFVSLSQPMASGIPEVWERFGSVGEAQSVCSDLRRGGGSHASVWPCVVTSWMPPVCMIPGCLQLAGAGGGGWRCCCNLTWSCPFFALSSKAGLSQGCNRQWLQPQARAVFFLLHLSIVPKGRYAASQGTAISAHLGGCPFRPAAPFGSMVCASGCVRARACVCTSPT